MWHCVPAGTSPEQRSCLSPGLASTPLSTGMSLTRCDLSPMSQLHLRNRCQREMLDSFVSPCPITCLPWIWTHLELTSICLWKRTLLFWYFEIALNPTPPIQFCHLPNCHFGFHVSLHFRISDLVEISKCHLQLSSKFRNTTKNCLYYFCTHILSDIKDF